MSHSTEICASGGRFDCKKFMLLHEYPVLRIYHEVYLIHRISSGGQNSYELFRSELYPIQLDSIL